jgi:prophage regulatory protein
MKNLGLTTPSLEPKCSHGIHWASFSDKETPMPSNAEQLLPLILRAQEAAKLAGISARTMRRLERDGQFPQRVILSARTIGWARREVEAWVEDRMRARHD